MKIIYKPHPKESNESVKWVRNFLAVNGVEICQKADFGPLDLLVATDLAVSLFSTVGYDLQNLLVHSSSPFSIPIYLFHNPDCRKWFKHYCKLDTIPMTENDMALVVDSPDKLFQMVNIGLDPTFRVKCHQSIIKTIKSNEKGSPENIIKMTIATDQGCFLN